MAELKPDANVLRSSIRELAIRLAWYIDKHGGIPKEEQLQLFSVANGFDHSEKALRIRSLATEIETWF